MKKMIYYVLALAMLAGCTPSNKDEATTKDIVAQKEELVVGLDDTFAPMGFRNESGEIVGFDVDLATEVASRMGVEIRFQPIDWAMKESELNAKNIDAIWNGYTITPEREEMVAFSKPYMQNRQIIITLSNSELEGKNDLSGKVISVQKESSALDAVMKDDVSSQLQEIVQFDTNIDCFMDLEAGRSDAIVCDEVLARYVMKQRGEEKYTVLKDNFALEEYGIGFRKEDQELVQKVNDALDAIMNDGTYNTIREKWFAQ